MTRAVAAVNAAMGAVALGAPVVLAVSGGADSVGMAELVVRARPDLRPAVVHVRHGLRDDRADADIAVAHARRLGLPWRVVPIDVRPSGTGVEDAARQARLAALSQAAAEIGADVLCTGHTADDQAETVLLNIARGSGLRGAAGMPQRRLLAEGIVLLRPVLALRRDQVRAVAQRSGLELADDPTNRDPQQRRARARHDVLPSLATLTGGDTDPVESLIRLARHAARDEDALEAIAAEHARAALLRWGPVAALDIPALEAQHPAVSTRMVRHLLAAVGQRRVDEATVSAVLGLADGQGLSLSGETAVTRGHGLLAVGPGRDVAPARTMRGDRLPLPEIGVALERDAAPARATLPPWAPPTAATRVPVGRTTALTVRARQPGDRIVTGAGTQLVAEAMSDAGVPRVARGLVPVVEDGDGILWIPGVGVRRDAHGDRSLGLVPVGGQ